MKKISLLFLTLLLFQPIFSAECDNNACKAVHPKKPKITQEELIKIIGGVASTCTLFALAVWYYRNGGKKPAHNHEHRNQRIMIFPTDQDGIFRDEQDEHYMRLFHLSPQYAHIHNNNAHTDIAPAALGQANVTVSAEASAALEQYYQEAAAQKSAQSSESAD